MRRFVLASLMLGALLSGGCDKMPWSSSSSKDDKKSSKDDDKKDKKKKSKDDDDDDKKKKSKDDDDDDDKKASKDDDDDDDKPKKKSKDDDSASFDTGISECDDYLVLYKKCTIDTLPKEGQTAAKDVMKTMEKSYKDAAKSGGAAKTAIADSCKTTMKSLKKSCKE